MNTAKLLKNEIRTINIGDASVNLFERDTFFNGSTDDDLNILYRGLKNTSIVQEVCQPIFLTEVKIFTYSRIYKNGARFYVSTDPDWIQHYFSNNFQDDLDHLEHYIPAEGIKYALWNDFKTDKVFQTAYDRFNYWHGISFYEEHEDYIDYFDFGAHKDNGKIVNFYLNKLDELDFFIQYFKDRIFALINVFDPKELIIPKVTVNFDEIPRKVIFNCKPSEKECKDAFLTKEMPKSCGKPYLKSVIELTGKEQECLSYITRGKTSEEISRLLQLSSRRVEAYIDSIRYKTKCKTRNELVELSNNSMIYISPLSTVSKSNNFSAPLSLHLKKKTMSKRRKK